MFTVCVVDSWTRGYPWYWDGQIKWEFFQYIQHILFGLINSLVTCDERASSVYGWNNLTVDVLFLNCCISIISLQSYFQSNYKLKMLTILCILKLVCNHMCTLFGQVILAETNWTKKMNWSNMYTTILYTWVVND